MKRLFFSLILYVFCLTQAAFAQSVGPLFTEFLLFDQSIGGASNPVNLGARWQVAQITAGGTFNGGTFHVQISGDGSTYANADCYSTDGLTGFSSNGWITAAGVWRCNISGANFIRGVRSSGSGGTTRITATASTIGNTLPVGSVGSLNPLTDPIPQVTLYDSAPIPPATVARFVAGYQMVLVTATGTFSGATFGIQTSNDNTNFAATDCYALTGGSALVTSNWLNATGVWRCNISGASWLRATLASGTPGTMKITGQLSLIGFAKPPGTGAAAAGGATDFSGLTGAASDAQIPNLNILSTGLTGTRCVETDASGFLSVAAGACAAPATAAGVSFSPTGTIGANNVQDAIAEVASEAQPQDADLTALATNPTAGFWAAGTNVARTLTAGSGLSITNPAGIAGNPTFALTAAADCIANSATTQVLFNNAGTCDGIAAVLINAATGVLTASGFTGPLSGNVTSTGQSSFSGTLLAPGKTAPGSPVAREIYVDGEDFKWRGNSGTPANQRALKDSDFAGTGAGIFYRLPGGAGYSILPPTDDRVLVGNGVDYALETLPDCVDSAGQHLNRNASTNTWSCGTSSTGGISGLTPGRLTLASSATQIADASISEDIDSINFLKNAEFCGGGACLFTMNTTIFATTEKTWSFPANVSSTFVGTDTAQTLTFKTIDVEGTGNVITTVEKRWFPVAACQNATASLIWDSPTTNAAAAACITGSNTQKGVADFDPTTSESIQNTFMLPSDWVGAIDVTFKWLSGTASTNPVAWCLQLVGVGDGETDDPAFPAQASGNCVSDAGKGTANQTNDATKTGLTCTNCTAGDLLHMRISRDPAEVSTLTDTHAADARLIGIELTYRRAQ